MDKQGVNFTKYVFSLEGANNPRLFLPVGFVILPAVAAIGLFVGLMILVLVIRLSILSRKSERGNSASVQTD